MEQLRSFENLTISGALIVRYAEASRLSRNIADRAMQLCARLVQDHQLLHQVPIWKWEGGEWRKNGWKEAFLVQALLQNGLF